MATELAPHEVDLTRVNGADEDTTSKIKVFVLTYTDLGQYQGAAGFEGVFSTRKKAWKEAARMIRKHGLDARGFYIAEVEIQ